MKHTRLSAWLLPLLLAPAPPVLAAPDTLGRLFYTPAQRAQLEYARSRNLTQPGGLRQDKASVVAPAPAPLRFDGVVIRSDGKATRWVNGKAEIGTSSVPGLKPGQVRAGEKVYEPYQVLRPAPAEADRQEPTP
ncbi:MAG: hypothetical protein R6W97_05640 [Thiobacillus sp.]